MASKGRNIETRWHHIKQNSKVSYLFISTLGRLRDLLNCSQELHLGLVRSTVYDPLLRYVLLRLKYCREHSKPKTFRQSGARIWFVLNDILLGNSRSTSGGEKDSLTKLGVLVPY